MRINQVSINIENKKSNELINSNNFLNFFYV